MEHTGVYTNHLTNYLIKKKAKFCVEMSLRIKRSMGITRGKTDKIDAKRIAEYSYKNLASLTLYNEPIKNISHLKMLIAYREKLIKIRVMHDNLTKGFLAFQSNFEALSLKRLSTPMSKLIKQSYKDVETEIKRIVNSSKLIQHQFKLLLSVINAIRNKLLRRVVAVIRRDTPYRKGPSRANDKPSQV